PVARHQHDGDRAAAQRCYHVPGAELPLVDLTAERLELPLERLVRQLDDVLLLRVPHAVLERDPGIRADDRRLEAAPQGRDGEAVRAATAVAREHEHRRGLAPQGQLEPTLQWHWVAV